MKMPVFYLVLPACIATLSQVAAAQNPYLKAAKKADIALKQQVGELLGKHNAHTVLYAFRRSLLQKLKVEAQGKVFVIESYSLESGTVYGTMWSSIDSLNYRLNGNEIQYNIPNSYPQTVKAAIVNWDVATCPDWQFQNNSIHQDLIMIQEYTAEGRYRVCLPER